jgi:pimeloyl-ACP methyl ester carboxylesterase
LKTPFHCTKMSLTKIGFYGFVSLLLNLALPSRGVELPATPLPLDGFWKGPLKMPGGQLEVIFRLVKLSNGEYYATLDVPLQKATRLAVTVTTRGDSVLLASAQANSHYAGRLTADGKQLEGIWQQPGLRVPLMLTHSIPAAKASEAAPRLTPPYREEEVAFSNPAAKLRLAGTLTIPAGKGPFPTVALLTDSGPQDRNGTVGEFAPLSRLADYLTRRGIAVLRFDDRGVGQSTGDAQATITERVSDAQAALNFLRTRPEINLEHLGLLGHGEGGNVALLAAAQPLPPAFVVGLAPYGLPGSELVIQQKAALRGLQTSPDELAAMTKRQKAVFEFISQATDNAQTQATLANMLRQDDAALDEPTAKATAAQMLSPHYRSYLAFNPVDNLDKVACPVLLLFGTADPLNTEKNLHTLTKSLKVTSKTVIAHQLPGVNHVFQPELNQWPLVGGEPKPNFSPAAQEAIRAWVVEQVAK